MSDCRYLTPNGWWACPVLRQARGRLGAPPALDDPHLHEHDARSRATRP